MDEKCFISRTHIIILTYHRTCHLSKTQSSDTPHTVLSVPNPNPMRTQKSQIFLRFPYLVHQPGPTLPRVHIPLFLQTITLHPYHVISYFFSLSYTPFSGRKKISLFFSYPTTFLWIQTLKNKKLENPRIFLPYLFTTHCHFEKAWEPLFLSSLYGVPIRCLLILSFFFFFLFFNWCIVLQKYMIWT